MTESEENIQITKLKLQNKSAWAVDFLTRTQVNNENNEEKVWKCS